MFNEAHREKMVFEDFAFDATDEDELKRREAETIELIKKGELPVKEIDGQVTVLLVNFENLTRVEGKAVCMYKLKMPSFLNDDATVTLRKDVIGFMTKNFNWEDGRMDCRIPIADMKTLNLHM